MSLRSISSVSGLHLERAFLDQAVRPSNLTTWRERNEKQSAFNEVPLQSATADNLPLFSDPQDLDARTSGYVPDEDDVDIDAMWLDLGGGD